MRRILVQIGAGWLSLVLSMGVGLFLVGCPASETDSGNGNDDTDGDPTVMPSDNANDNTNDGDATNNDNMGDPDDGGDSAGGLPFGPITGNELLVEGARSELANGDSRQRDERFTATWTLRPTSAEEQEVFINDVLTIRIFGDIAGDGQLTYEESGTDFSAELVCPTSTSSGSVEWSADVVGTYNYVPAFGTITLTTQATNVSSPEFLVSFTTPGCPEFDSQSPINYSWQGPGQGVWGFVDIVLQDGHFESRLDNPLGNDLGEQDFYEIEVNVADVP